MATSADGYSPPPALDATPGTRLILQPDGTFRREAWVPGRLPAAGVSGAAARGQHRDPWTGAYGVWVPDETTGSPVVVRGPTNIETTDVSPEIDAIASVPTIETRDPSETPEPDAAEPIPSATVSPPVESPSESAASVDFEKDAGPDLIRAEPAAVEGSVVEPPEPHIRGSRNSRPAGLQARAKITRGAIDRPAGSAASFSPRIWDGESRSFKGGYLAEAMLVRDLSVASLAERAGKSKATIYNALHGKPVRLRTARLLLEALANVQPTLDIGFALTDG